VLGAVRAAMLSAGFAALMAAVMSWIIVLVVGGERPAWAASLQTFGLEIALVFLPAAIGASALIPGTPEITRETRPHESSSDLALLLLLAALAVVAAFQAPSIAAWWAEDRVLLRPVVGSSRDPMGLNLIPQVILFSLPALAGIALAVFVLTSILGMLVRAELVFPALAACAALQAGLVIGMQLLLHGVRSVGGTVQGLFTTAPDATASAQVAEWFARHDVASANVGWRLLWVLGGYVVATIVAELMSPRHQRANASDMSFGSEPDAVRLPPPTIPSPAFLPPVWEASQASSVFDQSHYFVKPRVTLVETFLRHYSEYDIQLVPATTRTRFSFSWKTGVLRREPDGPDILALRAGDRHGVFAGRSHVVTDAATGATLGTLQSSRPEWVILDARGTAVARVVEDRSGVGLIGYVATVGEHAVCRFTWAMHGLSVASAGLDVEFLPAAESRLDKALAMALAPVLEHKARRTNARR
jgi:hypothetical protein